MRRHQWSPNQRATRRSVHEMNSIQNSGFSPLKDNRTTLLLFHTWISLVLVAVLLATLSAYCEEPGYHIDGTLSKIDRAGKETPWTHFVVLVSGKQFRISNQYFNGELLENGCDGTNSFFVNKMAVAKRSDSNYWEWASVSAGRFPGKDLTAGQVCWLAFVAYHSVLTNIHAIPLEGFVQNGESVHYEATPSSAIPQLPRLVKWYGSNSWYAYSPVANQMMRVRLPYRNGFLAGEYVVTSTTNFESFQLPMSFDLSFFIPFFQQGALAKGQPEAEQVTLVEVLRGRVSSVEPLGDVTDLRPELGPRVQIDHFKIPSSTNGSLRITRRNGKWPSEEDTDFRHQADVASMLTNYKAPAYPSRWITAAVVALMLLSLAFLIGVSKRLK